LRARKEEIENEMERLEEETELMKNNEQRETRNETAIAIHQESLQTTRALIERGDASLTNLEEATSQRLLKTGMEWAGFLKRYMDYVHDLLAQFDYKVRTLTERIKDEERNYEEVSKLHLKMDPNKFTDLIGEYQSNLDRFKRRRDKILAVAEGVKKDYACVMELVGQFGRQLEPLE
jgi:hypothetical protein